MYLLVYGISEIKDFNKQLSTTPVFRIENLARGIGVIMFCYKSNAIMFELRFSTKKLDEFTNILK